MIRDDGDPPFHGETPSAIAGNGTPAMSPEPSTLGQNATGDAEAFRHALNDIVTDTTLPVPERQVRLQALAEAYGLGGAEPDTDPLRIQLIEALGLLGEGGHG